MQALCDGAGIDEESTAEATTDVWIELVERELSLLKQDDITVQSVQRWLVNELQTLTDSTVVLSTILFISTTITSVIFLKVAL